MAKKGKTSKGFGRKEELDDYLVDFLHEMAVDAKYSTLQALHQEASLGWLMSLLVLGGFCAVGVMAVRVHNLVNKAVSF